MSVHISIRAEGGGQWLSEAGGAAPRRALLACLANPALVPEAVLYIKALSEGKLPGIAIACEGGLYKVRSRQPKRTIALTYPSRAAVALAFNDLATRSPPPQERVVEDARCPPSARCLVAIPPALLDACLEARAALGCGAAEETVMAAAWRYASTGLLPAYDAPRIQRDVRRRTRYVRLAQELAGREIAGKC